MAFRFAIVALVVSTAAVASASSVRLHVLGHPKCIGEDVRRGILMAGTYATVPASHPHPFTLDVSVTSPEGTHVHLKEGVANGHFGFTAEESGEYSLCYWLHDGSLAAIRDGTHRIDISWRMGQAASHVQKAAKKERVESFEWEVKRLEGLVEAASNEIAFFQERCAAHVFGGE